MRFLAVTDMHYSDAPTGADDRRHILSYGKLCRALERHAAGCDFVVNLGDTADQADEGRPQRVLLREVGGALRGTGLPHYSIIGNHDTSIPKPEFYPLLDMPDRYYTFRCGEYLGVVLDACLNDVRQPLPDREIEWKNCWVDDGQLRWLDGVLREAENEVLIFTHVPLMLRTPEEENVHLIRNRFDLMRRFADCGKVRAVFSGHYHDGCFGTCDGIPYITFSAMAMGGDDTYAVVDVTADAVRVTGFGRQASGVFPHGN